MSVLRAGEGQKKTHAAGENRSEHGSVAYKGKRERKSGKNSRLSKRRSKLRVGAPSAGSSRRDAPDLDGTSLACKPTRPIECSFHEKAQLRRSAGQEESKGKRAQLQPDVHLAQHDPLRPHHRPFLCPSLSFCTTHTTAEHSTPAPSATHKLGTPHLARLAPSSTPAPSPRCAAPADSALA